MTTNEHFDVVIVGAGLSGIGAACHLQRHCPRKSYLILESRHAIGGTWDLFRYPGVRSDSDMFTVGYRFRRWTGLRSIADGASIRRYIRDTAREHGVGRHIRFGHRLARAEWSSDSGCWTLEAGTKAGETVRLTCRFLIMCSGYYRYDRGYTPSFEGMERYAGRIVHPQHWPENLDCRGRRVLVIGSGATAMTLVPALAREAAHVTMVQRSPTYVISRPDQDALARKLSAVLPAGAAYRLTRARNIVLAMLFYQLSRRRPRKVKRMLRAHLRAQLGPDFDLDTHFTPRYNPWDQRLCLVPNGDLFRALRERRASVVTGRIERFTERGLRLQSGQELEADLIITATGLDLVALGGARLRVDGVPVEPGRRLSYKGTMLSDVPNMVSVIGYTNASWTLKCELTCEYACRLINYLDRHGYRYCVPHPAQPEANTRPLLDLSSGYVQRAVDRFPRQGSRAPWRVHQNYLRDLLRLRYAPLRDRAMQFHRTGYAGSLERTPG